MILNGFLFIIILLYLIRITFLAYIKENLLEQKMFVLGLFFIHFSIAGFGYVNLLNNPLCDANVFYQKANDAHTLSLLFSFGSDFLSFLIYPLVKLGVNMLPLTFLFATISYKAFLWYYDSFVNYKSQIPKFLNIPITQWLLLMPSWHYWSCFVSKDALVFFLTAYIFVNIKEKKIFSLFNLVPIVFIAFLRPYVFIVILIALLLHLFLEDKLRFKIKLFFSLLLTTILIVFFPFFFKFIRIKYFSYRTVESRFEALSDFAKQGGSGINLLDSNYFERIFLLLFRPLFIDAKSMQQIIISLENLMVFVFVFSVIFACFKYKVKISEILEIKLALFVALGTVLVVSTYIYNLGLASRMRLMFFPLILYVIHHLIFMKPRFNNIK